MLHVKIEDGKGTGSVGEILPDNAFFTESTQVPPFGKPQSTIPFRQFLTLEGTAAGTSDMRVDGSTISQEFFLPANGESDIYITALSFVISDAGAVLNEFGNINALSNGCTLQYRRVNEIVIIGEALTTNFEFIRLCLGEPAFGDGGTVFRANNISGSSEGYIPILDFRRYGISYGIRLAAGTDERLSLIINDDVSGVDAFNIIAYGFKRNK
jgi:hypothetical protein